MSCDLSLQLLKSLSELLIYVFDISTEVLSLLDELSPEVVRMGIALVGNVLDLLVVLIRLLFHAEQVVFDIGELALLSLAYQPWHYQVLLPDLRQLLVDLADFGLDLELYLFLSLLDGALDEGVHVICAFEVLHLRVKELSLLVHLRSELVHLFKLILERLL